MKKMDVVYLNDVERYAEVVYNDDNKVMGLVYTGPDYSLNDYYDEDIIEVLNYDKIEEGVQVTINYEEGKEFGEVWNYAYATGNMLVTVVEYAVEIDINDIYYDEEYLMYRVNNYKRN